MVFKRVAMAKRIVSFAFSIGLFATQCGGHGHMTFPPNRHGGSLAAGGACQQSNGACYWFTNNVQIPGEPKLNDARFRSMNINVSSGPNDWTRKNPWRAPGSAPVLGSGCGVAGGGPELYANGGNPPTGVKQGVDGLTLPKQKATIWTPGSTQHVGIGVNANHAGGYSWRLCKLDGNVNEACFQNNTLRFADSKQYIVYVDGRWSEIPLVKTTEGTQPAGSEWARFPVPSCLDCDPTVKCGTPLAPTPGGDYGSPWNRQVNCNAACAGSGSSKAGGQCSGPTQFPEAIKGLSGYGKSNWDWSIVDRVHVPSDLEAGEYLLSLRWDCEQSDQVFQTCADIQISVDAPAAGSNPEIAFDQAKKTSIYKPKGNSGCTDKLYEEKCQKESTDDCTSLSESDCKANVGCELYAKSGKNDCIVKRKESDKEADQANACLKLGEQGCSKDTACAIMEKMGKKYCWVAEKDPAKDNNGNTNAGAKVYARQTGVIAVLLSLFFASAFA